MSGNNGAGRLALQGGLTRRPSRADATGRRSRQDPLSALGDLQAEAGNQAVSQLLGRGVPLEPHLREDMEARFGTGFEDVRVHDDPAAHAVAESMHAKAWARGGEIGFGRGRFAPSSSEGRELLAHELAHVVQQRRGGTAPSWERGASNEHAADRAASAAVHGAGPVAVDGASGVGVARAEADQQTAAGDDLLTSMLNGVRRAIVERIVANAGYVGPGTVLVAKANEGISDQLFQELWREGKGKALLLKFASLGATGVAQAFGGYQIGLVEGLLSPATDAVKGVFGLGVVAESARNLAWGLLKSAYNASGQIGAEIQQVLDESKALTDSASATMKALASDPGTLKWLMSLPEAANQFAQQQAYALGKAGASKVVKALESPWEQKKDDAQPEPEFGLSTAAAWGYSKTGALAGAAHDWMIQSPGAKIGESIGYAVGVIAVQVLLLATTAGSASIIEGAGVALAKVASVVAKVSATAGKAVSGAAGMVVMLGGAIRSVEAVMARIGTAFKGAAVTALDGFAKQSGSFVRTLLALLTKLIQIAQRAEDKLPAPAPRATPRIAPPAVAANRMRVPATGTAQSRVPPPAAPPPSTSPNAAPSAAPADAPGTARVSPQPNVPEQDSVDAGPTGKTFTAGDDVRPTSFQKYPDESPDDVPTDSGEAYPPEPALSRKQQARVDELSPLPGGRLRPEGSGQDSVEAGPIGKTFTASDEARPRPYQKHPDESPDDIPTDSGEAYPPEPALSRKQQARVDELSPLPGGRLRPEGSGQDSVEAGPIGKTFTASDDARPRSFQKHPDERPDDVPTDRGAVYPPEPPLSAEQRSRLASRFPSEDPPAAQQPNVVPNSASERQAERQRKIQEANDNRRRLVDKWNRDRRRKP